MDWLALILKYIQQWQKKEPRIEQLTIDQLDSWVEQTATAVVKKFQLETELQQYVQKLKEERWILECKLDDWEKRIPIISQRKQRLEVREFFSQTRSFLSLISFPSILSPTYITFVLDLNLQIDNQIIVLLDRGENSFFAQNFSFMADGPQTIYNPLLETFVRINGLKDQFEQKITGSRLRTITNLKKRTTRLLNLKDELSHLKLRLMKTKNRLNAAKHKQEEKAKQLSLLQYNSMSREAELIKKQKNSLLKDLAAAEERIIIFFTDLMPVIDIYQQSNNNGLNFVHYRENPVQAFHADEGLIILHQLQHVQATLNAKETNGLDEERNILLDRASSFLPALQQECYRLQQELLQIKLPPGYDDYICLQEETKYRLDHFSQQVERLEESKSLLEDNVNDCAARFSREKDLFAQLVRISIKKEIVLN